MAETVTQRRVWDLPGEVQRVLMQRYGMQHDSPVFTKTSETVEGGQLIRSTQYSANSVDWFGVGNPEVVSVAGPGPLGKNLDDLRTVLGNLMDEGVLNKDQGVKIYTDYLHHLTQGEGAHTAAVTSQGALEREQLQSETLRRGKAQDTVGSVLDIFTKLAPKVRPENAATFAQGFMAVLGLADSLADKQGATAYARVPAASIPTDLGLGGGGVAPAGALPIESPAGGGGYTESVTGNTNPSNVELEENTGSNNTDLDEGTNESEEVVPPSVAPPLPSPGYVPSGPGTPGYQATPTPIPTSVPEPTPTPTSVFPPPQRAPIPISATPTPTPLAQLAQLFGAGG